MKPNTKLDAETMTALDRLRVEASVHAESTARLDAAMLAVLETACMRPDVSRVDAHELYRALMREDELWGRPCHPALAWGLAYAVVSKARTRCPHDHGNEHGVQILTWEGRRDTAGKLKTNTGREEG